jgi:hypothetical protein
MRLALGCFAVAAIGVTILLIGAALIAGIARERKHGTSGSLSSAALEIQSLLEPDKKRAAETMRAETEDEREEDDRLQSPPR